tara:strand:+ start:191 stop:535 length:345 start_codon:yes stop_codon:yes gene_type:complete
VLRFLIATIIFIFGQLAAWFQSNAGIVGGKLEENYILLALVLGPVVSLSFAVATRMMYQEVESLWVIRFLTFGIGYLIFIPLTWYFLGEEFLTAKNIISFCLCLALIVTQFLMK